MAYRGLIGGAIVCEGGTKVSAIATAAGVRLDSSGVSRLELALDTPARESVVPFWAAVLATEHLSGPDFGDELLGARRPPGQPGLPVHLAGPRLTPDDARSQARFSLLG
jgi:hypothetical protein